MNRRPPQRSWEKVWSQIAAQLARCEAHGNEDQLGPDGQRMVRLGVAEPYFGPTRGAGEAINRILGLAAGTGQMKWEVEVGKGRSPEMLVDALADLSLDTEARSAIALLLLDHADRLVARGAGATELLARLRWRLRADPPVQSRMRYWWTHMEGSIPVLEALG